MSNTNRLSYQKPASNMPISILTESQVKNDYDTESSTLSKAVLALRSGKMSLSNETSKSKSVYNSWFLRTYTQILVQERQLH